MTVSLLLIFIRTADQKPMLNLASKTSYKNCLLECMTCVEMWGNIYDGSACANGCALTDGASIDSNCEHGVNVGKRFKKLKAEDECKKQCKYCVKELSEIHFSESKCTQSCADGAEPDLYCTRNLIWYDMVA